MRDWSRRARVAGPALLAVFAACSGDLVELSVTLSLDENSCPGPDSDLAWLPCGGRLGVWLLSGDDQVLDQQCVPFAAEPRTVNDLPGLLSEVRFDGLGKGDRVAIELAVYSDDLVDSCPRFDPEGFNDPFPAYFGRSETVTLSGSTDPLAVDLSCYELLLEPCLEELVQISATVTDLDTWEPVMNEQPELTVSAGVVTQEGNYDEAVPLEAQGPEWTGTLAAAPMPDQCIGVVVTSPNAQMPFLSCEADVAEPEFVLAQGYVLGDAVLETILAAIGPDDPAQAGVGLGRLVTMENQPVAGAQVIPAEPGLTIQYLSEDLTSVDGATTASHGYFVVRGDSPGCCYQIFEVDPPGEAESHPFGLVPGLLTAIPVRLPP